MKIFVTGAAGQLGQDLMAEISARGFQALGCDIAPGEGHVSLDITDGEAVMAAISQYRPDAVIHTAAWTAVDAAEEPENLEKVRLLNAGGTKNIALASAAVNCKMMYISTDYVFGGGGDAPWQPDNRDFAPLNVYGQTKLEGELAAAELVKKLFTLRIAWVFGPNGKNFVGTMLALSRKFDKIRVVSDQVGTPTYTPDLARLICDMIQTEKYGTYHATNSGGFISWSDFAGEIFRQAGCKTEVVPVTTEEYGLSKALRPKNSRLSKEKLIQSGFAPLPHWQDALKRYLNAIGEI